MLRYKDEVGSRAARHGGAQAGTVKEVGSCGEIRDEVAALTRQKATLGDLHAELDATYEADEPEAERGPRRSLEWTGERCSRHGEQGPLTPSPWCVVGLHTQLVPS
jgi:hypothetical protein